MSFREGSNNCTNEWDVAICFGFWQNIEGLFGCESVDSGHDRTFLLLLHVALWRTAISYRNESCCLYNIATNVFFLKFYKLETFVIIQIDRQIWYIRIANTKLMRSSHWLVLVGEPTIFFFDDFYLHLTKCVTNIFGICY